MIILKEIQYSLTGKNLIYKSMLVTEKWFLVHHIILMAEILDRALFDEFILAQRLSSCKFSNEQVV